MKKSLAMSALGATLMLGSLQASAGDTEQAIEYRSGLMEVLGWNMKQMGAMLKGKIPFEQATFARRARDLNAAAHLDLLAGFPEDSVDDDSDAKDEIWLDWENFTAKLDTMRGRSETLARAAASGETAAIKPAFSELGKACKSCHKAFRK
jgi:cytochrome c556